jgi:hypothetical protein
LAQFDAAGRFDASVDLAIYPIAPAFPEADQPEFSTLAELASKVKAMPDVADCIGERAFIYAMGRHTADADRCVAHEASARFAGSNHSFPELLAALVATDSFRLRRAPSSP